MIEDRSVEEEGKNKKNRGGRFERVSKNRKK
jgi:hypothetical protein